VHWTRYARRHTLACGSQKHLNRHVPAEIEVYSGALHGSCVADMPLQNGRPIYNKSDVERAWGKLVALYDVGLAGALQ
jgi:dienelactone hydrolase